MPLCHYKDVFFYVSQLKYMNKCGKKQAYIMKNTMSTCVLVCVSVSRNADDSTLMTGLEWLSTRLPAEFLKDPTDAIPNSLGKLLMLPGARLLPRPLHFIMTKLPVTHPSEYASECVTECVCVRHVPAQQELRQPWQIVEKVPLNPALTSTWAWGLYIEREQSAPLLFSFSLHPSISTKWEREDIGNN